MLHAKFQDHRTSGSGVEDFQRVLPYMGMAAILIGQVVSEEKTFEIVNDNGQRQTLDHGYPKSSPMSLWLR